MTNNQNSASAMLVIATFIADHNQLKLTTTLDIWEQKCLEIRRKEVKPESVDYLSSSGFIGSALIRKFYDRPNNLRSLC
ncbi:hypothetical protein Bhyg_14621 [Pseudolycoriella hygida]|uniref:Uncharacterized protein n=1 Tax=Pseudolycoriella hygida TaxID=35572 RepID=A0A9Q0MS94_9DIPT|nr:hypothetical protein Bhyg_14621 [Pseudolycoriella hygida]